MPASNRERQLLTAEHLVAVHSAELPKELRLGDLVLSQILYITGLQWIGTAAKLGSAHIFYWIPAVLLFYIPSGMVVVYLTQEMPLEGGVYQWAKLRFGDMAGFLVALNLWATMVLFLASSVSLLTDNLGYAAGPSGAWMVENKPVTMTVGALMIGCLMWLAARGLALAKWVHNAGGLLVFLVLAAMAWFALPRWFEGRADSAPVAIAFPAVSLLNLNLLGKLGFGAFCGFDGSAIFSGEVRDPRIARAIRRSVWLSAPLTALFYVLGTACVLAFTRPADVDLISPAMQALSRGARAAGVGGFLGPFVAAVISGQVIANSSVYCNAAIRLPMVAGWDHLLPAWLSRLHPRFKTPVGSVLSFGVITFGFTVLGNLGVGAQETFQLLNNSSIICWALTYLVMFAIPLAARGEKPPLGVRVAALCGFSMTLLYVVLAMFPVVDVQNPASFAAKVGGAVAAVNALGAWYFSRARDQKAADISAV